MGPFAISALAFAALAFAVPHGSHQHVHRHIARSNAHVENLAPIAGRSISTDGSCGTWSGMTCGEGFCCGVNNWCGASDDYCGAGCQVDFGQCGGSSAAPISPAAYNPPTTPSEVAVASSDSPSGSLEVSPNGLCGEQYAYTCQGSNFGDSCSEWGYCGSNSSYSGDGCQPTYGSCGHLMAAASAPAPSSAETSSSPATSFANKGHPHSYGPSTTTLITKAQTTSTQAASAPPAYSPPAYSAPPLSSAEPTSQVPSPTLYTSEAPYSTAAAPPSYSSPPPSSVSSPGPYIKTYKGDGSSASGWPSQHDWLSASDMWSMNQDILKEGCAYFQVPNDSDDEISTLKSVVADVASSSGVDERFIFAIMLQESNGCVRAPTTSYSVQNPGLFQSHEGTGSCNNGGVQTPCPKSEMQQMVEDGVMGTASGDGLKQLVEKCAGKGAQSFYEAARMYNSGSVDPSGNLGLGVATHCYVSDVANRLTGWSQGPSSCDSTSVGL